MDEFKKLAIEAAREAGALALSLSEKKIEFTMKGQYDILAEADLKSQDIIINKIKSRFADHSILSEEHGGNETQSKFLWIIDPVDGTINYERHIHEYCVSIALEKDGELVLGVVFKPTTNELFVAVKGEGAYLNDKKIAVSPEDKMIETLFATENSSKMDIRQESFEILFKICKEVRGVRIIGSGAMHLANIARGHYDFYYKTKFNYWDVAAGTVLIREAGGKVTDFTGAQLNRQSPNIIASNGILHDEVLHLVNSVHLTT